MNKNTLKLKEIRRSNAATSSLSKEFSDDTLLLTSGENLEELEVLRSIGLTKHLQKEIDHASKVNEISLKENKYNRNIYTYDDVKQFCYDYDLKIRMASEYKGPVSLDIAREIIKLTKSHVTTHKRNENAKEIVKSEITLNDSNFWIITNDFNKGKSVTLLYRENIDTNRYYSSEVNKNDVFIEVASFGKPFSDFRKMRSLSYSTSPATPAWLMLIVLLSIVFTCLNLAIHWILLLVSIICVTSVTTITDDKEFKEKWKPN